MTVSSMLLSVITPHISTPLTSIFNSKQSTFRRQVQGLLPMDFIAVGASPVSRLILNALNHSHLLKVQIFKFLLGMEESGLSPRSNTWQFFLNLLVCVFELLGESLNSTLRKWSSLEGVSLPVQCIMDVLANLYNTDNPAGVLLISLSQSKSNLS